MHEARSQQGAFQRRQESSNTLTASPAVLEKSLSGSNVLATESHQTCVHPL